MLTSGYSQCILIYAEIDFNARGSRNFTSGTGKHMTDELLKFTETGHLGLSGESRTRRKLTLGIGVFDGVHLGHRRIIAEVTGLARANGSVPAAMTFDPTDRPMKNPMSRLISAPFEPTAPM